jgi:hypothetical protein
VFICVYLAALTGLSACAPTATPTLFLPPTIPATILNPTQSPAVTALPSPTPPLPTQTPPCSDGLAFLQDLTFPDGSYVSPGQQLDKQWLVTNNGTCNWDARYRLKLMDGNPLGSATELPLYPARAGTQAVIRILFTAPGEAGTYRSQWNAFGPGGQVFGDPIYIEIIVSP